jgi:hypothetical protein
MIYPGTKFRIGAVVVNIVLMGIVPMDSARWQGPDVPAPGTSRFDPLIQINEFLPA